MKVLYKIIEASEERFKSEPMCDPAISEESIGTTGRDVVLKNRILMLTHEEAAQEEDESQMRQMIEEVTSFNRRYKRKPKKFRKVGNPAFDPNYDGGHRGTVPEEVKEEEGEGEMQKGLFHSFMASTHHKDEP